MTFPFSELCTLLSRLEDIEFHEPPIIDAVDKSARIKAVTSSWFKSHSSAINALGPHDATALLSALLPERRTDRVYGIQSTGLCRILCRALGLSEARARDLQAYKRPGAGDLALCLERVLSSDGPPAHPPVSLSEVDDMLALLAGSCRFSHPNARLPPGSTERRDRVVGDVVKRLSPTHAKWLVRLILKDFSPVRPNELHILQSFHFLLPDLLRFQNTFDAALRLLRGPLKEFPPSPDPRSRRLHRRSAASLLKPTVGVRVGRPTFVKGRSIDTCIKLCGGSRWVLERKYDGEYCEIHIDMDRSANAAECITIFSKSGKDSTADREGLHQTLIECLRLEHPDRKIKHRAIILGELVVYSDKERRIMPFDQLRKHVTRSGISLGTDKDSYPQPHEHLAIVFFDILLLDHEVVMNKSLEERRACLRGVYTKIGGRALAAEWKIVDFSDASKAKRTVIHQFAASIAERCEGLVLKPCGNPYFSLDQDDGMNAYIKVKKDYIDGLGDEADLAVIGGSYDGQQALKSAVPDLRWTTFHLACLLNKSDVRRFDARPRFKVVGAIHAEHCIPRPILESINTLGNFTAVPYTRTNAPVEFDVDRAPDAMDSIFPIPFVFEILGSGFDKPSNSEFFMLRHPRVKKLHQDRDWKDCISYQELQEQADAARKAPLSGETQETLMLIGKLQAKCKKKKIRDQTSTPGSGSTKTPSTSGRARKPTSAEGGLSTDCQRKLTSTTSSKSTCLDGTTLVNLASEGKKRVRDQYNAPTPCPATKKATIAEGYHRRKTDSHGMHKSIRTSGPLADITNTAASPSPIRPLLCAGATDPNSSKLRGRLPPTYRVFKAQDPSETSSSPGSSRLAVCETSSCVFNQAVIYPAVCIANTPYIMQNLLSKHDAIIIPTLQYWDRDSLAHPPLTEIVSESQAYEGMRKIVLVEARRPAAARETVMCIVSLNKGKWRERVEVWDWRILESEGCRRHISLGDEGGHFLGTTAFDERLGSAVFIEREAD